MLVTPELLFTIGLLLGVIIRTLLPWLTKKAADPTIKFDPKFVWTAILAIITTIIEMGVITAEVPEVFTLLPTRLALLSGFFFGLGNNEIWNRILHRSKP